MSFLYGANRSNIAAAAVYSAPDPFGALEDPCQQTPVAGAPADRRYVRLFAAGLPTSQVHNACDIAGICPNSRLISPQLAGAGGWLVVGQGFKSALQLPMQALVGIGFRL